MITAITIYKSRNTVIFHHYNTSKQYDVTPDVIRWIQGRCILDGWKHKPNGHKWDMTLQRYIPITTDNDPSPHYTRPGIRFESVSINWTRKTITFTNMLARRIDRVYTVKSVKRLRAIVRILDQRREYLKWDSEHYTAWHKSGRKLVKCTNFRIR